MSIYLLTSLEAMYLTFFVGGLTFFRKGSHGVKWLMTLAPFLAGAVHLVQFTLGWSVPLIPTGTQAYGAMCIGASLLTSGALLVYGCALGSHRIRIPMWHQDATAGPSKLVSSGVYSIVRHPFYSSYLLLMPASCLAAPTIPMLCIAAYCVLMLTHTAVVEERELLRLFGAEYSEMMDRTGRFFPRLRTSPSTAASRA